MGQLDEKHDGHRRGRKGQEGTDANEVPHPDLVDLRAKAATTEHGFTLRGLT